MTGNWNLAVFFLGPAVKPQDDGNKECRRMAEIKNAAAVAVQTDFFQKDFDYE
jgi:hypothetical protein